MPAKNPFKAEIKIIKKEHIKYKNILNSSRKYKRSHITISEDLSTLKIYIEPKDATAMRASLSSTMRDIQVIESVTEGKFHKSKNHK
jgi:tRNA threonylcarbamoyladenosine modification (KEOPS) complex  Pcc1 subunit